MTEQELIDEGFQKEEVHDEDSQNGFDYYYYKFEVCEGVILISSDSDDGPEWYVKNFDWPTIKITAIEDVRILKELLSKWHA
jgi:hypothetical protein